MICNDSTALPVLNPCALLDASFDPLSSLAVGEVTSEPEVDTDWLPGSQPTKDSICSLGRWCGAEIPSTPGRNRQTPEQPDPPASAVSMPSRSPPAWSSSPRSPTP